MAPLTTESLAQLERPTKFEPKRDLRSANKEWKRGKDSDAKWSFGARPQETAWRLIDDANEDASLRTRPIGKASDL